MTKETIKNWVLNEVKEGSINLKEVVEHGCVNGGVSSLIYYEDTIKFHDKFENEIWEMLFDEYQDFGYKNVFEYIASFNLNVCSIDGVKNLLSWYAVENVASKLLDEEEIEEIALLEARR